MSGTAAEEHHAHAVRRSQPKALRFVTNYGAPHPKRRRIGAACLTCRKRKTACSGERPICETCQHNRLECAGYSSSHTQQAGHKRTRTTSPGGTADLANGADGVLLERTVSHSDPTTHRPSPNPPTRPTVSHAPTTPSNGDQSAPRAAKHEREQEALFAGPRNRMPYFRWLGPTAIMPGFKQMVVKVKRADTDLARSSTDGVLSPSVANMLGADHRPSGLVSSTPAALDSDVRTPLNLPFYDTSPMPPSELITHLTKTFFTHLGCNYPFLQRERFMRDLEEKQVDAILVDAVCALAARFSDHPMILQQPHDDAKPSPADYGHAFAQRAKMALTDTFACPSVAAVQAALLLAYNEFGESRDSGLWMYLGIAIRMAQDLGMHKLEGLKYKGRDGPTPRMMRRESLHGGASAGAHERPLLNAGETTPDGNTESGNNAKEVDEQKAVEQERVDTFWAVFFLDRVVSSGTGRRSTLRDKDIELSFPSLDEKVRKSDWPAPFPALIRIVHLYGRVADLLNSIKEPSDITSDTPNKLAAMEDQVTQFYQGLSPRLHFDAVNFQHYMKAGEGTNFVLLHFWFHTLIVLLHQPTLLKTFEGHMLQLFPNSQQLSMSSAKTIADILSYSQLMDAKASLGNPFTTQPIYIAACAFLRETAEQTASSNVQSRAPSPGPKATDADGDSSAEDVDQSTQDANDAKASPKKRTASSSADRKALAKHTLLATAASAHYQLCYKALQSLETYWAGTKYILTVLDQKFEGVGDPLLYTAEESESAMERPKPEPAFTSPGWRRKISLGPYIGPANPFKSQSLSQVPGSPGVDPSKAFGWTLTGTMNSPSTQLAWHYSADKDAQGLVANGAFPTFGRDLKLNGQYLSIMGVGLENSPYTPDTSRKRPRLHNYSGQHSTLSNTEDGQSASRPLDTAYTANCNDLDRTHRNPMLPPPSHQQQQHTAPQPTHTDTEYMLDESHLSMPATAFTNQWSTNTEDFGDMMIQSQDVDMSMLGLDTMPWFAMLDPAATTDLDGMSL